MLTSRCNQFEDTFENTQWRKATQMFFFIGQVSMGTHTLSGTRDYGIVQHRRDCMYVHHFRYCPAIGKLFFTVTQFVWGSHAASFIYLCSFFDPAMLLVSGEFTTSGEAPSHKCNSCDLASSWANSGFGLESLHRYGI